MSLYNRKALTPHTSATAEAVNAETAKISSAIDGLETALDNVIAGTPVARFTWVAWADSADGTDNFSKVAAGNRAYIGLAYDKLTPVKSDFPIDYTWQRLRGIDGSSGVDGVDGADGKWKEFVWQRSVSQPATPTGNGIPVGWSDEPPLGSDPLWMSRATQELDGSLLGTWSEPVRMDGEDGEDGNDGAAGANGFSRAIINIYQRAVSSPALPTATTTYTFGTAVLTGLNNGWTTSIPAGTDPVWISSASAVSQSTSDTIAAGEWAEPVVLASDGAGINQATVFLFKRTLTSTPPTVPSTTTTYNFTNGLATGMDGGWTQSLPASGGPFRWIISAAALSVSDTDTIATGQWASPAIIAEDGEDGTDGADGLNGANSAQVFAYRRSASAPGLPSATVTYNFAAKTLTGLNNGWTATVPGGTDPIYVTSATATGSGATDTIGSGEWAAPVILAANGLNGADGINTAVVFLFRRTTTNVAPAVPSTTSTYTFATGALTGHNNSWTQSLPASGGAYRWVITASALSSSGTDTIGAGEWANPTLLAEDGAAGAAGTNGTNGANGADGANGINIARILIYQRAASTPAVPSATATYTFATNSLTGLNNGWTVTIPGGTNPLYVTAASAVSANATDSISSGEWASPTILVQNGATGGNGSAGADGVNNVTVLLFQRTGSSSAPSLPSATVTYNFAAGTATGVNNGWTRSLPISGGEYRWVTSATALSSSTSDTISAGEWAAAALLAEDGVDGSDGANGTDGTNGRDAVAGRGLSSAGFPGSPYHLMLWYFTDTKQMWQYIAGEGWAKYLGDLASLNTLHADYIQAGTVRANVFLNSAGVDLNAMVPGTLGQRASLTGNFGGFSSPGSPSPVFGPFTGFADVQLTSFHQIRIRSLMSGQLSSPSAVVLHAPYFYSTDGGANWSEFAGINVSCYMYEWLDAGGNPVVVQAIPQDVTFMSPWSGRVLFAVRPYFEAGGSGQMNGYSTLFETNAYR